MTVEEEVQFKIEQIKKVAAADVEESCKKWLKTEIEANRHTTTIEFAAETAKDWYLDGIEQGALAILKKMELI